MPTIQHSALLGNYDRPTNQPVNQLTNRPTDQPLVGQFCTASLKIMYVIILFWYVCKLCVAQKNYPTKI